MPDPVIWQVIRVNKIFSEFIKLGLVQQFGNIVIIIIDRIPLRQLITACEGRLSVSEAISQYREIWMEGKDMRYWITLDTSKSARTEARTG